MSKAYCPNCDAVVTVDSPRLGALVRCPDCFEELEIISVDPFDVDYPADFDSDWDDDWDDSSDDGGY